MKVFSLSGKSGTGKSFQAVNLCKQRNIQGIIDDGLFICRNKVVAGISAKRQPTKITAIKTALFFEDEHCKEVREAISRTDLKSILVIGTSDEMVDKIIARLELPEPQERIYIEDITSDEERVTATKYRNELGQHVIPAPTFQIKRQFSGYFMSPMRIFRDIGSLYPWRDVSEKSVVRPSYSYLGRYNISEKVLADIVDCIQEESSTVYEVIKVIVTQQQEVASEGIGIYVAANFKYGENLPKAAEKFQRDIANKIEDMTAFYVFRVDLDIRNVI
ncbi:MAG: hypothetical protein PHS19_00705 [Eubacteriales bacterium]|nr:hypothetical protein [Eubacteriales bacterium]